MLIDSHCHLDYYDDHEIDGIVKRAKNAGVHILQTISTRLDKLPTLRDLAHAHDNVYFSVGVHPCDVQDISNDDFKNLASILDHAINDSKAISFGETGLDYYHSTDHVERQKESFYIHMDAAHRHHVPVIVHTRDATEDTIHMIKTMSPRPRGLIHCFSGNKEAARHYLDLGFMLSFAGVITFKNAESLRDVAAYVPLDRLLIETDAPFLAPVPYRGKRNEPSYVTFVAETIAQIRNVPVGLIAEASTANFHHLFSKVPKNHA